MGHVALKLPRGAPPPRPTGDVTAALMTSTMAPRELSTTIVSLAGLEFHAHPVTTSEYTVYRMTQPTWQDHPSGEVPKNNGRVFRCTDLAFLCLSIKKSFAISTSPFSVYP